MADITYLNDRRQLKSGGGGGTIDDMEARVKRLEDDMKEIKGDLKSLLQSSAEIKGKIDGLPSAYEFGQLKGRVDTLPTIAKITGLLSIATAVIVVLNNWSVIKALLLG